MYSEREERLIRLFVVAAVNLSVARGGTRQEGKRTVLGDLDGCGFSNHAENTRIADEVIDLHRDFIKE